MTADKPSIAELMRLVAELNPVPCTKRPPYGETNAVFDLEMARALLSNSEHHPLDQGISDSLWVDLRLACDEIERLGPILRAVPVLLEIAVAALTVDSARAAAYANTPTIDKLAQIEAHDRLVAALARYRDALDKVRE